MIVHALRMSRRMHLRMIGHYAHHMNVCVNVSDQMRYSANAVEEACIPELVYIKMRLQPHHCFRV